MDAAVGDEVLEGDARGLAAHGVEAREDDGLGGVVDYERDAGDLLEGADVAPLATDDATLEVVRGDVNGGDGDLAGLVGGAALDGGGDDLAGGLVGLGADALLGLPQDLRLLAHGLRAHAGEKLLVRLVRREPGDALELAGLTLDELVEIALATVELPLEARELVLSTVEGVVSVVEGLLALHDAVLERLELALALLLLSLGVLPELENLLLGLEHGLLLGVLRLSGRLLGDAVGLAARGGELGLRVTKLRAALPREKEVHEGCADDEAHQPHHEGNRICHVCSSRITGQACSGDRARMRDGTRRGAAVKDAAARRGSDS